MKLTKVKLLIFAVAFAFVGIFYYDVMAEEPHPEILSFTTRTHNFYIVPGKTPDKHLLCVPIEYTHQAANTFIMAEMSLTKYSVNFSHEDFAASCLWFDVKELNERGE